MKFKIGTLTIFSAINSSFHFYTTHQMVSRVKGCLLLALIIPPALQGITALLRSGILVARLSL